MSIRNDLLENIVIASGGIVDPPRTRNSLLQQWLSSIDGTNPIFQTNYTCQYGVEPRLGQGPATYTCASTAQYSAVCDILDRYIYDFDGLSYITIPTVNLVAGDSFNCSYIAITGVNGAFFDNLLRDRLRILNGNWDFTSGSLIIDGASVANATSVEEDGKTHHLSFTANKNIELNSLLTYEGSPNPINLPVYNLSITAASGNRFYPINEGPGTATIIDTLGDGSTDGTLVNGNDVNWIYDSLGVIRTAAIDQPRIEKGGVLLEGSATNLSKWSNDISSYNYSDSVGIFESVETNPTGNAGCSSIIPTPSSSGHFAAGNSAITGPIWVAGDLVHFSIYLKPAGYSEVAVGSVFGNRNAIINLSGSGSVIDSLNTVKSKVTESANGWYRVEVSYIYDNPIGNNFLYIGFFIRDNGTSTFSGDGVKGVLSYGFQVENANTQTSPIETLGVPVTRAATNLTYPVPAGFDPSLFSIECEFDYAGVLSGELQTMLIITNSTATSNRLRVYIDEAGRIVGQMSATGFSAGLITGGVVNPSLSNKATLVNNGVNLTLFLNGIAQGSITDLPTLTGLDSVAVGSFRSLGISYLFGHIKSLKINDYDVLAGA